MRSRTKMLALAIALALAATPTLVFAAGVGGSRRQVRLSRPDRAALRKRFPEPQVPQPALKGFPSAALEDQLGLPAGYGLCVPGLANPGQVFTGAFDKINWRPLKNPDVSVDHNSWVTADIGALGAPDDSTPLFGIAWGSFTASSGADLLIGGYGAVIQGSLSIDASCFAVNGTWLAVDVVDTGSWVSAFATGDDYEVIGAGGDLNVNAAGCLGAESATLGITGSVTMGTTGKGQNK